MLLLTSIQSGVLLWESSGNNLYGFCCYGLSVQFVKFSLIVLVINFFFLDTFFFPGFSSPCSVYIKWSGFSYERCTNKKFLNSNKPTVMNTWETSLSIGSGGKNSWSDSTRETSALAWSKVTVSLNFFHVRVLKVGNLSEVFECFCLKLKCPSLFTFCVDNRQWYLQLKMLC